MCKKWITYFVTVALLFGALSILLPILGGAKSHELNATYVLPEHLPVVHRNALANEGWDAVNIAYFEQEIYQKYRMAHAFFLIPNTIPEEHLLYLAEYANVITGNQIDPYLVAAIHINEVFIGVEIGGYTFYPRKNSATRVLQDKTYNNWQRAAFNKIIADINKNPRFKNVAPEYPVVSYKGAMGYFQILPTVWLHYRKKVLEMLGLKTASPYELIPSVLAANLILSDMTRYLKRSPHEMRLVGGNPLYFAQLATAYNAGAANTRDSVSQYGFSVYETAKRIQEARELELATHAIRDTGQEMPRNIQ